MKRAFLVAALAALPLAGFAAGAPDEGKQLAAQRGCDICHDILPRTGDSVPPGPAYRDIASRYKGRRGAEDRLVAAILKGAGGGGSRHWQGKARFDRMPANVVEVTPDEAHRLARWILR